MSRAGLVSSLLRRRVPVVSQLGTSDCGAACLAMILRYHRREIDLAEVRERLGGQRGGVTTLALVQAARSYGLTVQPFAVEPDDLARLPTPMIAHWGFDHYVIIERVTADGAQIVDPARGRRWVSAGELDEELTGVVLTLAPGEGFVPRRRSRAPAWRAFVAAYLRAAPSDIIQPLVASIVVQLLGLAVPLFTALLLDEVLPRGTLELMPLLAIGGLTIVLAQALTHHLRALLLLRLEARIDLRFVPRFFSHLFGLPLPFFEQRTSSDLLLRVASHGSIREILTGQTFSLLMDGALVVGYLVILLLKAPAFGGLVLAIGVLQAALLLASARRASEISHEQTVAQAEAQNYLVEMLGAVAAVKAAGAEERVKERYARLFQRQVVASLRRGRLMALVDTANAAVRTAAPLAMLWLGTSSVLAAEMSIGTMMAMCALGASFLAPVASLVHNGQRLPLLGTYIARLADVLEAPPEQEPGAPGAARLRGRLEVRDLGFRYAPSAPWVLRGVSLCVEPGESMAIVGRTGCGKTTLLKLLLGLYPPTEGEILYDGRPITDVDRRSLRRQFGVVLQDTALHHGSVRENIAFGDGSLPLERVIAAARMAAIDHELEALPMGYDTALGEAGGGLSGGQRQRVALARALAHDPAILFLDEATSHLDVVTEQKVERSLRGLACTRVVIAHRLSTVCRADRIVVLEDGSVVEEGAHAELVAAGGRYAAMVAGSGGTAPSATAPAA